MLNAEQDIRRNMVIPIFLKEEVGIGNNMPYRSKEQRAYMHAKHPKIAKKWDRKYGTKVKKKK